MLNVQVLIFSQFKIMLDVIEDSVRLCNYPVERIDGSVSSRDRQTAIDRFSKGISHRKTPSDAIDADTVSCMSFCIDTHKCEG